MTGGKPIWILAIFAVATITMAVQVDADPLQNVAKAISTSVAEQLAVAGLTAPSGAELASTIVDHYQDAGREGAIRNFYELTTGPKQHFEEKVTKILAEYYEAQGHGEKFIYHIMDNGGLSLDDTDLKTLQVETVAGIPGQVIRNTVDVHTGRAAPAPDAPDEEWDNEFQKYLVDIEDEIAEGANLDPRAVAARTISEYIPESSSAMIRDAQTSKGYEALESSLDEVGGTTADFLKAALRTIPYRITTLVEELDQLSQQVNDLRTRVEALKQENSQLRDEVEKHESRIRQLRRENDVPLLWALVGGLALLLAGLTFRRALR